MATKIAIQRKYITVAETAQFTGLSIGTIRNLLSMRLLTAFRPVPGRILLDLTEVDEFVRSRNGPRSTRGKGACAAKTVPAA